MTSDARQERPGRLRAQTNQSLRSFAQNRRALALLSLTAGSRGRQRTAVSGESTLSGLVGGQGPLASVEVDASTSGVRVDEERQVRAMAKEIKRLIVEDRRRGLGVGG